MSRSDENKMTLAWQRYEAGRSYNNRLSPNQYSMVNANIEFFAGNQWHNVGMTPAMQRLPKPVFNIIKRVTSLFVASLTSSATSVSFDDLSYYSGDPVEDAEKAALPGRRHGGEGSDANGASIATAEVQNLLEKFKMEYRLREALFEGAQTGDYCAHFFWNPDAVPYGGAYGPYRGEIEMELVQGLNVMFGNPNISNVEKQPYILIVGRDTVKNLEQERKAHSKDAEGVIDADAEYGDQAGIGGRTELEADSENGKSLYVIMYEKRSHEEDDIDPRTREVRTQDVLDDAGNPVPELDGSGQQKFENGLPVFKKKKLRKTVQTVHVTKATRSCVIYENIDTGLTRYPIAWGNWEKQQNQYHGRALVTGIIPNQIFINTMFAMVMRHLQLMGFPKTVYNADLIARWSGEVGQAIGVRGLQPGQNISQVAYNLQPADMSGQIIMAIDKAVSYTKDCLGATDAQLGNVRPDNTSALMVLQSSAEVPLENTRAGLYEWLEDIGAILLDMMGTYYGKRPMVRMRRLEEPEVVGGVPVIDRETGRMKTRTVQRRVVEKYDFDVFKNLWFNVRVNAGASTYYSEIAMVQTLDNLRRDGTLEVIDYLERIPDKLIPRKAELVQSLREKTGAAQTVNAPQQGVSHAVGGALSEDKLLASLPTAMQARYEDLPGAAQKSLRAIGAARQ